MAHNNGVISRPVNVIDDVAYVLGESSGDVGTLCTSSRINMWSKFKPVRNASKGVSTKAETLNIMKAAGYGFIMADGVALNSVNYTQLINYARTNRGKWLYGAPRGAGNNEWFRLLDFEGYNANTKREPPILVGMTTTSQPNFIFTVAEEGGVPLSPVVPGTPSPIIGRFTAQAAGTYHIKGTPTVKCNLSNTSGAAINNAGTLTLNAYVNSTQIESSSVAVTYIPNVQTGFNPEITLNLDEDVTLTAGENTIRLEMTFTPNSGVSGVTMTWQSCYDTIYITDNLSTDRITITDFSWWVNSESGSNRNWKYAVIIYDVAAQAYVFKYGNDIQNPDGSYFKRSPDVSYNEVIQLTDYTFEDGKTYILIPCITRMYADSASALETVYLHITEQDDVYTYVPGGAGGYIEDMQITSFTPAWSGGSYVSGGTYSFSTLNLSYKPHIYGTDHVNIELRIINSAGTVGASSRPTIGVDSSGAVMTFPFSDISLSIPATPGGTPLYIQVLYEGTVLTQEYLGTTSI